MYTNNKTDNCFPLLSTCQELDMSEKRLQHYQGCLFLLLARKVLGEAAWQDCVLACDSPDAPFSGLLTWSNMDTMLF